jgi:hypothetical protein
LMSQNAISRSNWGGRRKRPWAITGRKRPG